MLGGVTYETLSSWSEYSLPTLTRAFHRLLNQHPPTLSIPELTTNEAYLLVDGLWFGKRYALMLYRHSKVKHILHGSFVAKEFGSLIAKDLKYLVSRYRFTGIVSDGGTGIRMLYLLYLEVSHIRYVWHIFIGILLMP